MPHTIFRSGNQSTNLQDNFTETLDNSVDFDNLEQDDLTDASREKQLGMKVWLANVMQSSIDFKNLKIRWELHSNRSQISKLTCADYPPCSRHFSSLTSVPM